MLGKSFLFHFSNCCSGKVAWRVNYPVLGDPGPSASVFAVLPAGFLCWGSPLTMPLSAPTVGDCSIRQLPTHLPLGIHCSRWAWQESWQMAVDLEVWVQSSLSPAFVPGGILSVLPLYPWPCLGLATGASRMRRFQESGKGERETQSDTGGNRGRETQGRKRCLQTHVRGGREGAEIERYRQTERETERGEGLAGQKAGERHGSTETEKRKREREKNREKERKKQKGKCIEKKQVWPQQRHSHPGQQYLVK